MSYLLADVFHAIDNLNNLFLIAGIGVGFVCAILLLIMALQATIRSFKR